MQRISLVSRNHAFTTKHLAPMTVLAADHAFNNIAVGALTTGVATTVAAEELEQEGFPLTEPPLKGIDLGVHIR